MKWQIIRAETSRDAQSRFLPEEPAAGSSGSHTRAHSLHNRPTSRRTDKRKWNRCLVAVDLFERNQVSFTSKGWEYSLVQSAAHVHLHVSVWVRVLVHITRKRSLARHWPNNQTLAQVLKNLARHLDSEQTRCCQLILCQIGNHLWAIYTKCWLFSLTCPCQPY